MAADRKQFANPREPIFEFNRRTLANLPGQRRSALIGPAMTGQLELEGMA